MQDVATIEVKSDGRALGVAESEWKAALAQAQPDLVVGIRHAPIKGDTSYRFHVAAIPAQVGCHFHAVGNEEYAVVQGSGTLHWGRPVKGADGYSVQWGKPVDVTTGDSFVIPEGCAHQLRRRGTGDLVILFGCPDSHLNDTQDRTMLPSAP